MRNTRRLYRSVAGLYDAVAVVWEGIRRAAMRELALRGGETVVDLGCGTGLSLPWLVHGAGPAGRVIGVDRSREMLRRAARRAGAHGWGTVRLVQASAAALPLPDASAGLVLCCLTHDLVADPRAMAEAVRVLAPGGRLLLAGVKLAEGPLRLALNPLVRASAGLVLARPVTARPWDHARTLLGEMTVHEQRLGTSYVAAGVKPQPGSTRSARQLPSPWP